MARSRTGSFGPIERDLKNFGPKAPKGKDKPDPMEKPPFKIGKPTGQKPPPPEKKR